jgi:mutator protein MutT
MEIQQVTVKAIIINDGRILLLKDLKGKWELPGGRIDFGESPIEALNRELDEELGVKNAKTGELIDVWTFTIDKSDIKKQIIVIVFECFMGEINIKSNNEFIDYAWFEKNKIDDLDMKDGYKKSIIKYWATRK